MGIKHAPTGHIVAALSRQAKTYQFKALMAHYPIGLAPRAIVPSKVIKVMVEVEQEGFGQGRVASWKDNF